MAASSLILAVLVTLCIAHVSFASRMRGGDSEIARAKADGRQQKLHDATYYGPRGCDTTYDGILTLLCQQPLHVINEIRYAYYGSITNPCPYPVMELCSVNVADIVSATCIGLSACNIHVNFTGCDPSESSLAVVFICGAAPMPSVVPPYPIGTPTELAPTVTLGSSPTLGGDGDVTTLTPTPWYTPTTDDSTPTPTPWTTPTFDESAPTPTPEYTATFKPTLCGACIQYTIGSPEPVKDYDFMDPDYPDQALTVTRLPNGEFRGYSALSGSQLIIQGQNLTNRVFRQLNIKADPPNYYTHDLEAVWWDPSKKILRGWVHIETHTCEVSPNSYFHGEIYYAESTDGGLSWYPERATYTPRTAYNKCPIEYPNNTYPYPVFNKDWVITSAGPYRKSNAQVVESGTKNSGTGAHFGITIGDYLYIYHTDFWAEVAYNDDGTPRHRYGTCVARAHVSTGGKPGHWFKWYNGSWSEPGVYGRCNPVQGISGTATSMVPLVDTDETIAVNIPPNWAGYMSASLDGIDWKPLNGPFLPQLRPRRPSQAVGAKTWFQGYNSIIVDEHNQPWLYGMVVLSDIGVRQIIRYPITFTKAQAPTICGGRIALNRYRSLTSTAVSVQVQLKDTLKWASEGIVAYVSVCSSAVTIPLVECQIRATGVVFLARDDECDVLKPAPDQSDQGSVFLGGAGFVSMRFVSGLGPLWRCWFPSENYFDVLFTSPAARFPCEEFGGITQTMLVSSLSV